MNKQKTKAELDAKLAALQKEILNTTAPAALTALSKKFSQLHKLRSLFYDDITPESERNNF